MHHSTVFSILNETIQSLLYKSLPLRERQIKDSRNKINIEGKEKTEKKEGNKYTTEKERLRIHERTRKEIKYERRTNKRK